jgi:CRP/FNR family transcriptional regulator, polysaccharide utilization system transcription regulator
MISMELNPVKDTKDCLTCSYRSQMFNFLSRDELQMMKESRIPVVFKKGEIIRKQGASMTHVISVTHGLAKLYREGTKDTNTIMRIVRPTNFIGGPGIFFEPIHHFTVAALTETWVCFIDLHVFKKILDSNRKFEEAFLEDFSKNALLVYYRLIDLSRKMAPGRMADALLYLFEEEYDKSKFKMLLSKQDLADLSAMSKDSATKILRDFQNNGIITQTKDEITLLDPEALRRVSKNG